MNSKFLAVILIVALLAGVWVFNNRAGQTSTATTASTSMPSQDSSDSSDETIGSMPNQATLGGNRPSLLDSDDDEIENRKAVPASQQFKTAAEAIDAVKKGAVDYDDFLLEGFVQLGDCSWCNTFYPEVTKLLRDPSLGIDERSYYGELLAVSGKLDNIKEIVKSLEGSKNDDEKDMYAESLELAVGGNDMVQYLSSFMDNANDSLRESAVSAISNQGSRLAAELLYKDAVSGAGKDHDYYSLGIGFGEMVPDDDALPFLQDLVIKRAPHSDLAIKALINSGLPGLTIVFDSLASETDEAKGKKLLTDASDHVISDDPVVKFLTKASQNSNYPQFLKDFAKQSLEEAEADELDDDE